MRMAVRKKIVLVMALFVVVSLAGLSVVRYTQRRTVDGMCGTLAREFDTAAVAKAADVKAFVTDYTYWDELMQFVKSGNARWAAENLVPCLREYNVDGIWVSRPDGTAIFAAAGRDTDGVKAFSLPREAYEKLFAKSRFCHFFVNTPRGLLELHGATIHPTKDPGRKTSPGGYFFAGKLWTDDYLKQVGSLASLVPPDQAKDAIDTATTRVIVTRPLPGWNGKAVMAARIAADSPLIAGVSRALDRQFYAMALAALSAFFLLYFLLTRWITRPLELIYGSLDSEDTSRIAKLTADGGEFGYIAQLIVRAFEQKSQLVRETVSLRASVESFDKEKEALARRVQALTAEFDDVRQKYDKLLNAGGAGSPGKLALAYVELERKFQDQRTKLHVVNELLQREMIKSHEHYQAELSAAHEREQALKELNHIYAELEQQKTDTTPDEMPVISIMPAVVSGVALSEDEEPVLAGAAAVKRPRNRRKCLGANLPKIKYTETGVAQAAPVHSIPSLQN